MSQNEEKNGDPGGGRDQRILAAARSLFDRGMIRRGLDLLDRSQKKEPADPLDRMDFLVSAVRLALIFDRGDLAARWIEAAESWIARSKDMEEGLREENRKAAELLKLWVRYTEENSRDVQEEFDGAFSGITRWKPWIVQVRMMFLYNQNRLDELQSLLRRSTAAGIRRGTIEYAARLEWLGMCLIRGRKIRQSAIVFTSALRELDGVPRPEACYARASGLVWLARALAEKGEFSRALRLMEEAEALGRRFKAAALKILINHTLGSIHFLMGEYEKALRSFLKTSFLPAKCTPLQVMNAAFALLHAARCALKAGNPSQANRLIRRALPAIKLHPHPLLCGALELLQGDLSREKGTPSSFANARSRYDKAEEIFGSMGAGHGWWLGIICLSRSALHLKEKHFARALQEAHRGLEIGRVNESLDLQAESLLLKSFLLLHEESPRLDLYELILRHLGVIRDPVTLFKVLANLYIYSWELEEHLELTDLHLKQIHGLRDILPPETYERLYRTHVTDRVLARFRRRLDGGEFGGRIAAGR